ncbi:hypothetical protein HDU82_006130 [Entophlyctis luteolus]|nr:hypothetical protein HDU82_006130 [Entophlyctis luteolus]KAJ3377270.1 hypothetical protein HDU84_008838 [Entophlyctis sp. JEL0112]
MATVTGADVWHFAKSPVAAARRARAADAAAERAHAASSAAAVMRAPSAPGPASGSAVRARLAAIAALNADAYRVQLAICELHSAQFTAIVDSLCALSETLVAFRHSHLARHHEAFAGYFCAAIKNIYRKLNCLELEMDAVLFGPETAHAREMEDERRQLNEIRLDTTKQLEVLDKQLAAYQGAGPEFERVLGMYFRIGKDIHTVENDIIKMTV